MLSKPWFHKWIPEFFSSPPLHHWWEKYLSGHRLNEEDKLFPEYWYVGARYKTTVLDSLLTLRHWQKTGLWEYFYTERNPSLYWEYLNK